MSVLDREMIAMTLCGNCSHELTGSHECGACGFNNEREMSLVLWIAHSMTLYGNPGNAVAVTTARSKEEAETKIRRELAERVEATNYVPERVRLSEIDLDTLRRVDEPVYIDSGLS